MEEFDTGTGAVASKIVFPTLLSRFLSVSVATGSAHREEEYLLGLTPAKCVFTPSVPNYSRFCHGFVMFILCATVKC